MDDTRRNMDDVKSIMEALKASWMIFDDTRSIIDLVGSNMDDARSII